MNQVIWNFKRTENKVILSCEFLHTLNSELLNNDCIVYLQVKPHHMQLVGMCLENGYNLALYYYEMPPKNRSKLQRCSCWYTCYTSGWHFSFISSWKWRLNWGGKRNILNLTQGPTAVETINHSHHRVMDNRWLTVKGTANTDSFR